MEQRIIQQDRQSSYKLVIPLKVELKIKQLLEEIYNTEWSGILFCTYKGSLKNGLTIICKDILPMNIGNTTFTSFEVNEELSSYMLENNLLDCQQHLIHSHHNFDTSFSGTDLNTLEVEGKDRNNFISLIVNNEGKYKAAITWKGSYTIKSTTSLFGKQEVIESTSKDTTLFYSYMTIEREFSTKDSYLSDRIKQLKRQKEEKKSIINNTKPSISTNNLEPRTSSLSDIRSKREQDKQDKQLKLDFGDNFNDTEEELSFADIPDEIIDSTVAKLLSWNLLATSVPEDRINEAINFISKRIDNEFKDNPKEYKNCLEQFVMGVIETTAVLIEPNESLRYDTEMVLALVLKEELEKYSINTKYVKDMVELIKDNWE